MPGKLNGMRAGVAAQFDGVAGYSGTRGELGNLRWEAAILPARACYSIEQGIYYLFGSNHGATPV